MGDGEGLFKLCDAKNCVDAKGLIICWMRGALLGFQTWWRCCKSLHDVNNRTVAKAYCSYCGYWHGFAPKCSRGWNGTCSNLMRKSTCTKRVSFRVPCCQGTALFSSLVSALLWTQCLSGVKEQISNLLHMYFQVLSKTVTEIRWPKLVSPFECCWGIGIVVTLSFSIKDGIAYLVLLRCLLTELIAKITKHYQSLLPPLTPAWKLIFDSSQSCVLVSICSVVLRSSLLPSACCEC